MKKLNRGLRVLLCLALVMAYLLPGNMGLVYAESFGSVEIIKIQQTTSNLQPGDTFSLKVEVSATKIAGDGPATPLYISNAYALGEGITTKNMGFSVDGDPKIEGKDVGKNITISGLKYTGGSKEIEVIVEVGADVGSSAPSGSASKAYTLSAKTSDEFEDILTLEKEGNLVVKTGQTQNVKVKLTNTGSFTVNQAEMKLALDSKVKGLEIKNDTATINNLKSKETKSGSFSVKVDEDVKAGIYPATITVNGNSFAVNIQVDSSIVPSALEVSVSGNTIYTPGVANNVSFNLKNVGERDAKNIRFEVVNAEDISIVEASNVKRLDKIGAKSSQTIAMKVRVGSNFKGDSVPVQIKIEYLNSDGEKTEDIQYVYLATSASSVSSEVVISNVVSPSGTYEVDKNFTVKFNVSSKSGAENLKISVKGDEGIVPKSQNLFFLNKLGKGETKQYSVTFAATNQAITSSHPIEISIEYGDAKEPTTINQYGSVNISNPKKDEEADKDDKKLIGKPKVIIGEYKVDPVIVEAGENFELNLVFLNTNKKNSAFNIKANLKAIEQGENQVGNVFTPVGGSNTFYIDELAPGEKETKTVTMFTIPSAKAKTYEVSLEMVYEDKDGNEITETESIGIPVEQVTSIDIGDIYVDYAQIGFETSFSASIYNRGRTDVTNMMVYIEGEGFTVSDNKQFIGNFKQGDSENYEPTITANESGMLKGQLVIEYDDTAGKPQEIRKDFEFTVEEPMPEEDMMMGDEGKFDMETMPEEQGSTNIWLFVGIGVGVVVAIIITLIVIKKRKAKKEKMMLDEEE